MTRVTLAFLCCIAATPLYAAQLKSVTVLDRDFVVVHISDGDVTHNESPVSETISRYTPVLNTTAAVSNASWTITSPQDASYGGAGRQPVNAYRKTKLSGHGQMEWTGSDFRYEYTYDHRIFLRLPSPLQQGMTYTVTAAAATNASPTSGSVTFDIYNTRSEAVHVNLAGYVAATDHKAADLYAWLGNGGARDYSSFEGNTVYVYNVGTGQATPVGTVAFWKPSGPDVFSWNLTRSAVWNVDFPGFTSPGTYRLAVEGVGASQDFTIANDVYANPFRVSLRGFYYMRIGQDNPTGISPPPRTPLYIPGSSPANTVVYLTTVTPYDPVWQTIPTDQWDRPDDWAPYRKPGNPTNPNAYGGHSDAADWDRHLGHVSIIYDMLLPYVLTNGALGDDAAGIRESGNGVPDVIDEARNEVDFWLRLRDGAGYSHGLTNPNGSNQLFQAGPTAMAAWANAANAAMLAEAYRIAGQTALANAYRDAAIAAYNHASGLPDQQLDATQDVGYTTVRGRDLKMTAAAYLFNVTGSTAYEDVVNAESVCRTGLAELENDTRNQTWATAAYLFTPRTVRYPALQGNLRACVIDEARSKEANLTLTRPSRRATDDRPGYFRTSQNVQRTMIAHAAATSPADRELFRKALQLEADWGLGRNPINTIEMGTATTPLAGKRSIQYMYTSGREDGVPGIHPGHTPYLNLDDWFCGMTMGCPSRLYQNTYPADFRNTWPIAEGYFNTPWVWAHSEFTPQQTMRGKTALYGYLYALGAGTAPPPTFALTVGKAGTGTGTVTSSPAGIDCGSDCAESYASGTSVALTASAAGGSTFAGWSGACSGTGACSVSMTAARSVTATFDASVTPRGTFGNNGNPWSIAASGTTRIQAENFDTGGQGVAYNDSDAANSGGQYRPTEGVDVEATTDTGGGHDVGWVNAGEWLEYTVNVAAAGTYDLRLRVARQPAGTSTVSVLFGGVDKTGSLTVPSTGGWQTWTNVTRTGLSLAAGQQIVRIALTGASFNVNWVEITAAAPAGQTLTVTKAGAGNGTVTSSPAGIACGGDCTETYASGTSVALTAAPVAGSTFAGWSGACTGAGGCTVSMTAARSVTATFNGATPAVTIYGDALAADWANWSWSATIDFNGTNPVRVGTRAINVTYQGWGGLSLRKGTAQSTSGATALRFWVHGGTGAAKSLRVSTQTADAGAESGSVVVSAPASTWTEIVVPLSALGSPASIKRVNIQENSGATQPMMTFDEIRLAP
jgi:endoglucanase